MLGGYLYRLRSNREPDYVLYSCMTYRKCKGILLVSKRDPTDIKIQRCHWHKPAYDMDMKSLSPFDQPTKSTENTALSSQCNFLPGYSRMPFEAEYHGSQPSTKSDQLIQYQLSSPISILNWSYQELQWKSSNPLFHSIRFLLHHLLGI